MIRTRIVGWGLAALTAAFLAGCHGGGNMADMMKPPPRPAELDHLNKMVGNWEGTAEIRPCGSDEVMKGTGKNTTAWDADKWMLVEHWEHTGEGNTVKGVGVWSWGGKANRYYMSHWDNRGGSGCGVVKYDEKNCTWRMKGKSRDGVSGHKTFGKGTFHFVDDNTIEWKWAEYWDCMRLFKLVDMHGTSKRK